MPRCDPDPSGNELSQLARCYGIEQTYHEINGTLHQASEEVVLLALKSLGVPIHDIQEVPQALAAHQAKEKEEFLPPVTVIWEGQASLIPLCSALEESIDIFLTLESGETYQWPLTPLASKKGHHLLLPQALPLGYHTLRAQVKNVQHESLVIVAPTHAFVRSPHQRLWGVFIPLYALHSKTSWGFGNFSDLKNLDSWVSSLGGDFTGTLPLLPIFADVLFDPSPYSPVSRFFWNEFFIDLEKVPELSCNLSAREQIASTHFQAQLTSQRSNILIDYKQGTSLRRGILEKLAGAFFSTPSPRLDDFKKYRDENEWLVDYSSFRSILEEQKTNWHRWPAEFSSTTYPQHFKESPISLYHQYAQWVAFQQMEEGKKEGKTLYLDFPVGVHPDGFDTWKFPHLFAMDFSTGCPPDPLCQEGQNWGFYPLIPHRLRETRYAYFIQCLRHHLRYAGILRMDHVMGLHRLFWIPQGLESSQGLYVNYPAEEFYAILCLESQRHATMIVGEDLGTVPPQVRDSMKQHGFQGLFILQFQEGTREGHFKNPPVECMASLNTHDTETFAAFYGKKEGAQERLNQALKHLAKSPSKSFMVNLEDLWLEDQPQNKPGTGLEASNWQRKSSKSLEEITSDSSINSELKGLDELRK